jgi:hypothetical protein
MQLGLAVGMFAHPCTGTKASKFTPNFIRSAELHGVRVGAFSDVVNFTSFEHEYLLIPSL